MRTMCKARREISPQTCRLKNELTTGGLVTGREVVAHLVDSWDGGLTVSWRY